MATYTYTGRLTDFSSSPFPNAMPNLWIQVDHSAFGPHGPLATRRIAVDVASNGNFSVSLIPSVDTVPPARYRLLVEWLNHDGVTAGWTEWSFVAPPGGGVIKPDSKVPLSVWYVGPPWPPGTPPGFYFDRFTNDVGRKE